MTLEESITIAKCLVMCDKCDVKSEENCSRCTSKAISHIIEAAEKQIPKKPAQKTNKRYKIPIDICPSCGGEISTIEIDYEYCPDCGKKIDWGNG